MMPNRVIRTARLVLTPVSFRDLPELTRLKGDPRAFAQMLGGVRSPVQVAEELADDIVFWGSYGAGIFAVREQGLFQGIAGLHRRPDGRGPGLRFAVWPEARGRGLAREAAGAALRYALDAGVARVVAVAREDNFGSRMVLGGIGMTVFGAFVRDGMRMLVYETVQRSRPADAGRLAVG